MNPSTVNRNRVTAWEGALRPHVEELFAVFPGGGGFDQAAVTVLGYELALEYDAPKWKSGAERPDLWAAVIARAVEALFPETDVAAVTEFLARVLAREFDPPYPITNKNHSERMGQSAADLSLREGALIAAWHRSLAADVHQIMPLDPLAADALTAALAVRLSTRYKPPCRRTPLPADNPR